MFICIIKINMSKDLERSKIKNAENWAKMLVDSNAKQVIAPSAVPRPTVSSRLVRSLDIPYTDTNAGYTTVVLNPDPKATYGQLTAADYPVGGPGEVSLVSRNLKFPAGVDSPSQGYFEIQDDRGTVAGITRVIPDGGILFPARAGNALIPFQCALGVVVYMGIDPQTGTYICVYSVDNTGAVAVEKANAYYASGTNSIQFTLTANCEYLLIARRDSANVNAPPQYDAPIYLTIHSTAASVLSTATNTTIDVVPTELLEQGRVSHAYMTSGQLMVTNLASPYDAGGEIVIARVLKSMLAYPTTASLMEAIKSLSEKDVWKSLPLVEGGYGWYFPDDFDSYQPHPIDQHNRNDNVVVACIKMASAQGQIRVNFTSTWDYYSPAQILQKKVGHTWCDESRAMLEMLSTKPAVSGNPTHVALVAGLKAAASAASKFYLANKAIIDPIVMDLALSGAKKVFNKKKK